MIEKKKQQISKLFFFFFKLGQNRVCRSAVKKQYDARGGAVFILVLKYRIGKVWWKYRNYKVKFLPSLEMFFDLCEKRVNDQMATREQICRISCDSADGLSDLSITCGNMAASTTTTDAWWPGLLNLHMDSLFCLQIVTSISTFFFTAMFRHVAYLLTKLANLFTPTYFFRQLLKDSHWEGNQPTVVMIFGTRPHAYDCVTPVMIFSTTAFPLVGYCLII